jgi:hypothetical protein
MLKSTVTILLFITILIPAVSQDRIFINGKVTDAQTNEPVPFTNIHFKERMTGTITHSNGEFSINTGFIPDTLIISSVGYNTKRIPITKYENYHLNIELEPVDIELMEVIINPGENPANRIMRNVIERKDNNNPMNIEKIKCNTYTKILVHAKNDKDPIKRTDVPIYFSEKISTNTLQKEPFYEKGEIIAERQEGLGFLNDMSIIGYSNNLSLGYNFYDGVIEIFEKPFIGPLNNRAFLFYKFYLADSTITTNGKEYTINIIPKNNRDLAFNGYIKVIDDLWAISELSLSIPQNANLNYVNKLDIFQSFQVINDSLTFYKINNTSADLKITKDESFLDFDFMAKVNKRSLYDNIKTDFPTINPSQLKSNEEKKVVSMLPGSVKKLRPESLTQTEKEAIIKIDSLNNDWRIKSADALSQMFITGYIPGNIIDLGPYLELVKKNKVEGFRYTFAGRTSASLTKNTMIYGQVGYGTRDNEWKYGLGVKHKLNNERRRLFTLEYRNDLSRVGDNRSIFLIKENMMVTGEDNVIASIFTNDPLDKLSREIRYTASYEHEWKKGFTTYTGFNHRKIHSGIFIPFTFRDKNINHFSINEINLGLRLSWKENYTDNYCRRYYMGTPYPIINIRLTGGQYHIENSFNEYLKARLVVNHDINFGQTKFEYVLESGFTLGDVPFPLLDIHRTDQSLGFALYSFNMMNEMEFASDRFASLMAQYHLNGLLFNRIPILKQLGIREVASAKVLWGNLSPNHKNVLDYPLQLYDANTPYTEVSLGVENFFQYFRFDFVWRLNYLNHPGVSPVGIRARFDVTF